LPPLQQVHREEEAPARYNRATIVRHARQNSTFGIPIVSVEMRRSDARASFAPSRSPLTNDVFVGRISEEAGQALPSRRIAGRRIGGRKMADYAHRAARCADPIGSNPPYGIAIRLTALQDRDPPYGLTDCVV
jgi:hypothetical protein